METGDSWVMAVVGTGEVQELVASWHDLPEPVLEVLEWRKSIFIRQAEAIHGGVMVSGFVRSRCLLTEGKRFADRLRSSWGQVLHSTREIDFTIHIAVPGTTPGMQVKVTEAYVRDDVSRLAHCERTGLVTRVLDRSLVVLSVRVLCRANRHLHTPAKCQRAVSKRRKRQSAAERSPHRTVKAEERVPTFVVAGRQTWVHPSAMIRRPGSG